LSREKYGDKVTADLKGRAEVELATALRRCTRHAEAEAALVRASQHLAEGTGSESLRARHLTVRGALYGDELRYREAYEALDAAAEQYRRLGDDHNRGQALAIKATYAAQVGDLDDVIEYLTAALPLIDDARDPYVGFAATHNLIHCLILNERFAEARALLRDKAWRYAHAGQLDQAKRLGLEGMIAAGLGEIEVAERVYLESKEAYESLGDAYHVGIVELDLGCLYLERGQIDQARRAALEAAGIFRTLSLPEEGLAAVRLLEDTARARALSAVNLRAIANTLRTGARSVPPQE
jgi:tetratricopeptide (TPR) repeat protein